LARRLGVVVTLALSAIVLPGCASDAVRDTAPPPKLGTAYPPEGALRLRRVVTSSAHNPQLAQRGRPDGVDSRAELAFVVQVEHADGARAPQLLVRPESLVFETKGLRGDVSFDSRDPESMRALERTREGPAVLAALRAVLGEDQRTELAADGTPQGSARVPVLPIGLWEGSLPGMPPFGAFTGTADVGRSQECEGVLRAGRAGLRYDDPLTFRGTWTIAAYDASAHTVRLVLTGATSFDDARLRTTRVVSLALTGEAVWDADLRLVTHSSVAIDVELYPIDEPDGRIEWRETIEEELVR
jgi:hypothetical protein